MSIRSKLLIPLLALAACLLAAMHFIAFNGLKQTLAAERLEGERRALDLVALAIAPDLMSLDLAKIHETLDEVGAKHPWWRGVTLRGANGDLLYPLAPPPGERHLSPLVSPVAASGRSLGNLSIALDRDALVKAPLEVAHRMELASGLILLLGTLAVLALQSHWVAKPLRSLAEASRLLSEGRYDVALPPPSGDEVGGLVKAFQAMRDAVSHREAAIRHSEQRLAAVIDNSAEAVMSLDGAGTILSLNRAAEGMFAATAEDVVGTNIAALLDLGAVASDDGAEIEAYRLDGASFPAFVTTSRVEMAEGEMVVATILDLTERKESEESLKESEGRFRDLAESASDWFWETDTDYRLTFVSDRVGAILGVKPSAVLGFSHFDLGLNDYDLGLAQAHAEDLDALRPFRDLVFHIGPAGAKDEKIVRISGMPFYDQHGAFIGYRGIGADVTREARAEQRARAAQQQLADAIECVSAGIAVFDSEDRLVLYNREYHRVFENLPDTFPAGATFNELILDSRAQLIFDTEGKDYGAWADARKELHARADGKPFLIHLRNGTWLHCREVRAADGGVVGIRTDITDLKRREQDLDILKRRYQLILDCAGDGIVGLDGDGRVTFANRMAAGLLGRPAEAMVGQAFTALVKASEADHAALGSALRDGVAERVGDALFTRADGPPLPVEYLAASLIEEERVVGAVLVFRDVTMRRQYERALADQHTELERLVEERTEALKEAQREALHASRLASVGQLAAGIAHEINTPIQYIGDNLSFIQGAATEMIPIMGEARALAQAVEGGGDALALAHALAGRFEGGNLDFLMEETPPALAQSLEGVAQVARIVLSMKEFSHPGTTQKSAVDLNRALESTLVVSRNTWKQSAEAVTRLDPALPLVNCHPGEMNQVFLNLIVNAAHAIEASGKPGLGTITVETAHKGDFVEITVSDTGTGVPDAIKDQIFDPFFTTKEVGKGTGQGLAICYDVVVTKHGGQIIVGGKEGEGASFTLRLPVA